MIYADNHFDPSDRLIPRREMIHSDFPILSDFDDEDDEQQNISYLNSYKATILNYLIDAECQGHRRIYLEIDNDGKKIEFSSLRKPKDSVRFVYGNPSFTLRPL